MMPRRRALMQSGAFVLLLGVRHRSFGASIVAVRVWPAPDYSRVTIESAGPLKARHALVTAPPRLVVDIDELELNGALRELVAKVQPDDPNIARIRVGQYAPGVVRLVLDLKRPIQPQVFNLPPVAAYRDRLVFDLYPAQAPDPLETLIAERLRDAKPPEPPGPATAATPAASAGPATVAQADPLGDLIARQSGRALTPTPAPVAPAPPVPSTRRNPELLPSDPLAPDLIAKSDHSAPGSRGRASPGA